jgi:small subunit ribosomal protein SAe
MAAAAGGGAVRALSQKEQDIQMMLAADVHLGTKNCDFQMERYAFKRRTDGICLRSRIRAFFLSVCQYT